MCYKLLQSQLSVAADSKQAPADSTSTSNVSQRVVPLNNLLQGINLKTCFVVEPLKARMQALPLSLVSGVMMLVQPLHDCMGVMSLHPIPQTL